MSKSAISRQTRVGRTIKIDADGLTCDEDLIISGDTALAKIDAGKNSLVIDRDTNIEADLYGDTIVIMGHVRGNVTADSWIEITDNGTVHGDMSAPKFQISTESIFQGRLEYIGRG